MLLTELWDSFLKGFTLGREPEVDENDERSLWNSIVKDGCPDCHNNPMTIREGPSGGMMTNVMCADCGSKFNISAEMGYAARI